MKYLVFDAGPLISLALGGMIDILGKLKKKNIEFVITSSVRKESIEKAMNIKKYKLDAMRISTLIEKGILKNSSEFVPDEELRKETDKVKSLAKQVLRAKQERIELIHDGEASCLAFSKLVKGDCLIVVDERTTRLLSESPEELKNLIEKKTHLKITLENKETKFFKDFKFIRSSELIFRAYKEGFLGDNREILDAVLYNLKYHGTTISSNEIEEMKKLI